MSPAPLPFRKRFAIILLPALLLAAGCDRKPEEKKPAGPPPTLITLAQSQSGTLEVTAETVGTLESPADPKIAAEVPGRVARILAGSGKTVKAGEMLALIDDTDIAIQASADAAEARRVKNLLAQAERYAARQQDLVQKNFISRNAADDAIAQRDALREQHTAASARAEASFRSQTKTRVIAPMDGVIDVQIAAVGDYVKVGDPLFNLVSNRRLRAHLPFPETAAPSIRSGQTVRIGSPQVPGKVLEGRVAQVRPSVADVSRAIDVLVDIDNDGSLRGGGTVNAAVVLGVKENVVTVPEQSVVLRPAGKVVYIVAEGRAAQRVVTTGASRGGLVEIVSGLAAGETVALDGAGFLTDKAPVAVAERKVNKPGTAADGKEKAQEAGEEARK